MEILLRLQRKGFCAQTSWRRNKLWCIQQKHPHLQETNVITSIQFVGGQPHKHGVASSKVIQTRACKAPGDSSRRRQLRLIGESMIRLRNQWALIRASDRKKGRSIRGECALIRATDRKTFVNRSGCLRALIRAIGRKTFVGRTGSQRALIRATTARHLWVDRVIKELW